MTESRRPTSEPAATTPQAEFRKVIHEALKNIRKETPIGSPLQTTRLYKVAQQSSVANSQSVTHQILQRGLQTLAEKFAIEAQILRQHFWEGKAIQAIAADLNMADGTVYNKQSEGISRLAELLYHQEEQERTSYRCALEARLQPPSNTHLVGLEQPVAHLVDLLCTTEAPWLVALAGMGGIGKTTLADAVARAAIGRDHFADIGWVTAKQQLFGAQNGLRGVNQPALSADALIRTLIHQLLPDKQLSPSLTLAELQAILCTRLGQRPHLIIIDNLETLTDLETLLDTLRDLANPTKFLLTSRVSLFGEPDIYHYPVPELTAALTLHLVRQEARLRNLPDLLGASDADLQPIVATVGATRWRSGWWWGRPMFMRWISFWRTCAPPKAAPLKSSTPTSTGRRGTPWTKRRAGCCW